MFRGVNCVFLYEGFFLAKTTEAKCSNEVLVNVGIAVFHRKVTWTINPRDFGSCFSLLSQACCTLSQYPTVRRRPCPVLPLKFGRRPRQISRQQSAQPSSFAA